MSELKPCPFCGGEAEINFSSVTDYGNRSHQNGDVTCKNRDCDAEVGLYDFNPDDKLINPSANLVRKWNTRAPQSEWISVKDSLPDADMQVLITDKEHVGHARLRSDLIGDRFQIVGLNHYEPISNVTHWMPLPPPPEAK